MKEYLEKINGIEITNKKAINYMYIAFNKGNIYTVNKMYRSLNLNERRMFSKLTGFKPFPLYTHIKVVKNLNDDYKELLVNKHLDLV